MMLDFNGNNRGFCFVTYQTRSESARALKGTGLLITKNIEEIQKVFEIYFLFLISNKFLTLWRQFYKLKKINSYIYESNRRL